MREVNQVHLLDLFGNQVLFVVRSDAFDRCVEVEVLLHCQMLEDSIELWTVANQASCFIEACSCPDVVASHL